MTRLVLVRHGQSSWNQERRIQGQSGTGLSALGREQAALTARWLAESLPDAHVVTSDLQRCQETVAPLAALRDVTPAVDPDLRERGFGRWEGRTVDEVATADPETWARWKEGVDVLDEIGGESGPALTARVVAAYERLADAHDTVVAVTHGGPVWHGVHELLALPHATLGGVGNTSITELVREQGRWRLEAWNQLAHLPTALRTTFRPSEAGATRR